MTIVETVTPVSWNNFPLAMTEKPSLAGPVTPAVVKRVDGKDIEASELALVDEERELLFSVPVEVVLTES